MDHEPDRLAPKPAAKRYHKHPYAYPMPIARTIALMASEMVVLGESTVRTAINRSPVLNPSLTRVDHFQDGTYSSSITKFRESASTDPASVEVFPSGQLKLSDRA